MFIIRDKVRNQAIRSKSAILMEIYKQMRNRITRINMQLKQDFYTNKIASQKDDLKGTWKTINMALNGKS